MSVNMDKQKIIIAFNNYIEECRNKIKNTIFSDESLVGCEPIKTNLVELGKINKDVSLEEAIKFERLDMINTKINHTIRVIENVLALSKKIGTQIDFNKVLAVSALLHDIGRFDQATWNNSFSDKCYKDIKGINNHAQAGYNILFNEERINEYGIDNKLYTAIGSVVYNHGNSVLTGDLALKFKDTKELDISVLTGLKNLNREEKIVVAALVQMVRDADMIDILYQNLTDEIPIVRDYISFNINGYSINDISKYWDINPEIILKYNNVKETDLDRMNVIKIPVDRIDLRKLEVSSDLQQKFFSNEDIDLKELMDRKDWNFITGMWWRLSHFLNNINFTSNLKIIEEKKLLDKIYNKYPNKFKFLVRDAFFFAKEILLLEQLEKNSDSVYVKKLDKY